MTQHQQQINGKVVGYYLWYENSLYIIITGFRLVVMSDACWVLPVSNF